MKLLLTAFDPFGGEGVNPALEAMKRVPGRLGHTDIIRLEIPTVFGESIRVLMEGLREHQPDAVLCLGQAGGRPDMTPERVAINLDDAPIPDNQGNQPIDKPIVPGGAPAYFSTLPIKAMAEAMLAEGIPASISNSAGTFVCNHLMYGLLHTLAAEYPGVRGGFMHVPYIPEQTARLPLPAPSLHLANIVRGIELSILAIQNTPGDSHAAGGSLS